MATFNWTTNTSGDWTNASLWTPATVPNDVAADVVIDAAAGAASYTATIATGETETVHSLSLNSTNNVLNVLQDPYSGAVLEVDGKLVFAPGSDGAVDGPLQNLMIVDGGTIVNAGTVNAFVQGFNNVSFTGTNGLYFTNWLQAQGIVTIDQPIAELTGGDLFDGIFEAQAGGAINLGGAAGGIVNISTIEGPPLIPDGWTELRFDGPGSSINEWNGLGYTPIENTLTTILNRGTVDVLGGRDYTTENTLTIDQGLLNLAAGTVTTSGITLQNAGSMSGSGIVAGPVLNNGSIVSEGAGLVLNGTVSGTGSIGFLGTGGTLEVGAVGAGQTITMGGTDTLKLDSAGGFLGTIAAGVGDSIALLGVTADSAAIVGSDLVFMNEATTVATLHLAGSYSGDSFTLSTAGGNTGVTIAEGPPPPANFTILDTTTNITTTSPGDPYTGPVAGLEHQYAAIGIDNLNITSAVPNAFIRGSLGMDGINVSQANGNNILDGAAGSNFLTGGAGNDTFYVDNRDPQLSPIFSTIVNFHSGDNATMWGVNATDFSMLALDNQGAAGFTGLDLILSAPGHMDASFVLAGYTSADLTSGRLSLSYGATPDQPGVPGSQYMTLHAN